MGAPSLFRGPRVFLSETATWCKRRRLGRKERIFNRIAGAGMTLAAGLLGKEAEGHKSEKTGEG